MAARQIILPYAMPARDLNGRALASKLYFYTPGATLNTPKTVYQDVGLAVEHPFPIPSDMAGRFAAIWADEDEYYDVVWTDSQGTPQKNFYNARGLSDSLAGSAIAAQVSADAALVSETNAATSESNAADDAGTAAADADRAEAAASAAVLAAGFDPADYVQVGVQTLSTPEKTQARTNIGAVSQADVDESIAQIGVLRSARTSNTILAMDDNRAYIDITSGTFSQTITAAASLGDGWFVDLGNSGAGVVTADPNASETINGLTTLTINPGEIYRIICDGTNFHAIALKTDLGPHVIFQDQKASGTVSGAHSGTGYASRIFNTTVRSRTWASLSSGKPVLDAGTYFISAWAAYGQQGAGDPVRAKIQNTTDAALAILGPGHRVNIDFGGFNRVEGVVTITAQKTFDLQQYMLNNVDTDAHGYAVSTGDVEIYAEFAVTRLF